MKVDVVTGDPRTLTPLKVNARFMRHETYQRLVDNLRTQQTLTSTPFVWKATATESDGTATGYQDGDLVVLSGNHRVEAAIEADLAEITWLQCDEYLESDERLGIQISHNSLTGEDDPGVLRSLYEQIEALDWKQFAAIDDNELDLLNDVSFQTLKPANLSFQTMSLTFLPGDWDEAQEAWNEAERLSSAADEAWLARYEDHFRLLQAIYEASTSHNVKNMGAALTYVLDVFMAHRDDLAQGWVDDETGQTKHKGKVPIITAIGGLDEVPPASAAVIRRAIKKMQDRGEITGREGWRALEKWASQYLETT